MQPDHDIFELPLCGAQGYAAIETLLYPTLPQAGQGGALPLETPQKIKRFAEKSTDNTNSIEKATLVAPKRLSQGTAFTILAEVGDYWQVQLCAALATEANCKPAAAPDTAVCCAPDAAAASQQGNVVGYLYHPHCFVNLPDVLPSVIYCNTNASACVMHSSGFAIPDLTGQALYASRCANARLGRAEYRMPLLYHTAKCVAAAQKAALAAGDCLVVYELFRPLAVQQRIVAQLSVLAAREPTVHADITTAPWEMSWFIATGVSNHQRGMAMDVGLAKVEGTAPLPLPDGSSYTAVTAHTLYEMPSPIHELSTASASMAYPVSSRDLDAWRTAEEAPAMTQGARLLRSYCTAAGLTPLASEWWHFNDWQAVPPAGCEQFRLPAAE